MALKTIALSTSLTLLATTAFSQTTQEDIVQMLTADGYTSIEIKWTLFGNIKIEGEGPGVEREIVLGKDGTILRDRLERDDADDEGEDDEDEDDDDGLDGDEDSSDDDEDDSGESEDDDDDGDDGESDDDSGDDSDDDGDDDDS